MPFSILRQRQIRTHRCSDAGSWWVVAALVLVVPRAALATPFETDGLDPAEHFEIKTAVSSKYAGDERSGAAPSIEFAVPVHEDLEASTKFGHEYARDGEHGTRRGLGDVEFEAKWAVVREEPGVHPLAVTLVPAIAAPTGSESRGLGDGAWKMKLPITVGHTFGNMLLSGEAAYEHVFNGGDDDDEVSASALATFRVSDVMKIGVELAADAPSSDMNAVHVRANVGFKREVTPSLELQGLVGRTIENRDGGSVTQAKLVVLYTFQ